MLHPDARKLARAQLDLVQLARDVELARTASRCPARDLCERALALLDALSQAEAEHETLGLAHLDFPFEAAQADLSRSQGELARLAREIADAFLPALSDRDLDGLREIAFLGGGAPVATAAELAAIRRARQAQPRAKRPA